MGVLLTPRKEGIGDGHSHEPSKDEELASSLTVERLVIEGPLSHVRVPLPVQSIWPSQSASTALLTSWTIPRSQV